MDTINKTYKKYQFKIFFNNVDGIMLIPCAYIKLPDSHRYAELIDLDSGSFTERPYDKMNVDCHWGLTFAAKIEAKRAEELPQEFDEGYWIGWDYGHAGDYIRVEITEEMLEGPKAELYKMLFPGLEYAKLHDKKWTVDEIEEECKSVIDQLIHTQRVITY